MSELKIKTNENKRSSRGKRFHELTAEEKKLDDQFWNNNTYFKGKIPL